MPLKNWLHGSLLVSQAREKFQYHNNDDGDDDDDNGNDDANVTRIQL